MIQQYKVMTTAGDPLNGKSFPTLDSAQTAVRGAYPQAFESEVDMPGSQINAWEYTVDGNLVAQVLPTAS